MDKSKVLIVEDDKFLRELSVRKLAQLGFDVKNAVDSTEAFGILETFVPDLILLDLMLPGESGFDILEKLKKDSKLADVPVVVFSNLGQKDDIDKAKQLGARDFWVKASYTLDEIADRIKGLIDETKKKK